MRERRLEKRMETDMDKYLQKAKVLIEALPYIQKFNRKIIVVKYGGSAMSSGELQKNVIEDVTLLKLVGFKPVIVHGGGREISRWVEKVGMEPAFVNGLRVTDEETMEIAEMVLNKVNKSLVQKVQELGVKAVVININADDAACAIAKEMYAEKLAFLTDIEGVYRYPDDKDTFLPKITVKEAEALMKEGLIGGGMMPKLKSCIEAMKGGVRRVHILDGRIPHCILLEIFTDKGIGTAIVSQND